MKKKEQYNELMKFSDYVHLNFHHVQHAKTITNPNGTLHEFIVFLGSRKNKHILSSSSMNCQSSFLSEICTRAQQHIDNNTQKLKYFDFDAHTFAALNTSMESSDHKPDMASNKFHIDDFDKYAGWVVAVESTDTDKLTQGGATKDYKSRTKWGQFFNLSDVHKDTLHTSFGDKKFKFAFYESVKSREILWIFHPGIRNWIGHFVHSKSETFSSTRYSMTSLIRCVKKLFKLEYSARSIVMYKRNPHYVVNIDVNDKDRPYQILELPKDKRQEFGIFNANEYLPTSWQSDYLDFTRYRPLGSGGRYLANAMVQLGQLSEWSYVQKAKDNQEEDGGTNNQGKDQGEDQGADASQQGSDNILYRWVSEGDLYPFPIALYSKSPIKEETTPNTPITPIASAYESPFKSGTLTDAPAFGASDTTDWKELRAEWDQKMAENKKAEPARRQAVKKVEAAKEAAKAKQTNSKNKNQQEKAKAEEMHEAKEEPNAKRVQDEMSDDKKEEEKEQGKEDDKKYDPAAGTLPPYNSKLKQPIEKDDTQYSLVSWPYALARQNVDGVWVSNTHEVHKNVLTAHVPWYLVQKRNISLDQDRMRLSDLADAINQLPIVDSEDDIWGNKHIHAKLSDLNSGQKKQLTSSIYAPAKKSRFEYAWLDWLWEAAFTRTYDKDIQEKSANVERVQRMVSERRKNFLKEVIPDFLFNPKTYFQFPSNEFADKIEPKEQAAGAKLRSEDAAEPPYYLGRDAFHALEERLKEIDVSRSAFFNEGSEYDNCVMLTQNLFQYDVNEIDFSLDSQDDNRLQPGWSKWRDYFAKEAIEDDNSNVRRTQDVFERFMSGAPQEQPHSEYAKPDPVDGIIVTWQLDEGGSIGTWTEAQVLKAAELFGGEGTRAAVVVAKLIKEYTGQSLKPYETYKKYFLQHIKRYRGPDNNISMTKENFNELNEWYQNEFYTVREGMLMQWIRGHNTFQTNGIVVPMLRLHTAKDHKRLVDFLNKGLRQEEKIVPFDMNEKVNEFNYVDWLKDLEQQGRISGKGDYRSLKKSEKSGMKGQKNNRKFVCFLRCQGTDSSWWWTTASTDILAYYLTGQFLYQEEHNVAGYSANEEEYGGDVSNKANRDYMQKNDLLFMFSGMVEISACAQVIDLRLFSDHQTKTGSAVYIQHAGTISSRVKAPGRRATWMNVYTTLRVYHLCIEGVKIPIVHDSQMSINMITNKMYKEEQLKKLPGKAAGMVFSSEAGKNAANAIGTGVGSVVGGVIGAGVLGAVGIGACLLAGPPGWLGLSALISTMTFAGGLGGTMLGSAAQSMAELAPHIAEKEAGYIHHHFEVEDLPDEFPGYSMNENADVPAPGEFEAVMEMRVKKGQAQKWNPARVVSHWWDAMCKQGESIFGNRLSWLGCGGDEKYAEQHKYHIVGGSHGSHRRLSEFLEDARSTQHEIETNSGKKISIESVGGGHTMSYRDADGKKHDLSIHHHKLNSAQEMLHGSNGPKEDLFIDKCGAPWYKTSGENGNVDHEYELPYRHIRYNKHATVFNTKEGKRHAYANKISSDPTQFLHDGKLFRTAFRSEFLVLLDEEVLGALAYMNCRLQRNRISEMTLKLFMTDVLYPIMMQLRAKTNTNETNAAKSTELIGVEKTLGHMARIVNCKNCSIHNQKQQNDNEPKKDDKIDAKDDGQENKERFGSSLVDTTAGFLEDPSYMLREGQKILVDGYDAVGTAASDLLNVEKAREKGGNFMRVVGEVLGDINPVTPMIASVMKIVPSNIFGSESEKISVAEHKLDYVLNVQKAVEEEMKKLYYDLIELQSSLMHEDQPAKPADWNEKRREKESECHQIKYVKEQLIATLSKMQKKRKQVYNLDEVDIDKKIHVVKDLETKNVCEVACNFLVVHKRLQMFHLRIDEVASDIKKSEMQEHESTHDRFMNEKAFLNDTMFDDGYEALVDFCVVCLLYEPGHVVLQRILLDTCVWWLVQDHRSDPVFEQIRSHSEMNLLERSKDEDMFAFLKRPPMTYSLPKINDERIRNECTDEIYLEIGSYMRLDKPETEHEGQEENDDIKNYDANILRMRELVMYTIETQVRSISGTVYSLSDVVSAIVDHKSTTKACVTNMELSRRGQLISTIMDHIFWSGEAKSIANEVFVNFFSGKVRDKNIATMKKFRERILKAVISSVPNKMQGPDGRQPSMPWRVYIFTNIIRNTILSNTKNNAFDFIFSKIKLSK